MNRLLVVIVGVVLAAEVYPAATDRAPKGGPKTRGGAQAKSAREPRPDELLALPIQVALDRQGFSPGEIDGRGGANTRSALLAFQRSRNLADNGNLDDATRAALGPALDAPTAQYAITPTDAQGPFAEAIPKDLIEQSTLPSLAYTSALELLAERFHASPALLRHLNPAARFEEGETIVVPNVEPFQVPTESGKRKPDPAAQTDLKILVVNGSGALEVLHGDGTIAFHAPVTIGSEHDPLPIGEWKVTGIFLNPVFNYNPELFWDADQAHAKARIAPGPNNPVGVVWIAISKEHFGFHGTPEPSRIGYTQSHGCVRLTNWDALRLAMLVNDGTPVTFQ